MQGEYLAEFQAGEWVDGKRVALKLQIRDDQLEENVAAIARGGALGRLRWSLVSTEISDKNLAEKVDIHFTFDEFWTKHEGEGKEPRGFLHVDGSREPLLNRKTFDTTLRFEVFGGRKLSTLVARPVYRVRFLRRAGTHTLAIDFGTTASCIALKRILGDSDPTLQQLGTGAEGTLYPSSIWVMDQERAKSRKKETVPVVIGGHELTLGFGERNVRIATLGWPSQVISSLKRMIEVPSRFWGNFGIPDDRLVVMPSVLLWGYLHNLFKAMLKRNKTVWQGKKPPLLESVVVTVPNKASSAFINRLKAAVLDVINSCNDGPLTEGWEMQEKHIHVLREADAAAADFVFRHPREGGLGEVGEGQIAHLAVFDMGAGTCDSALILYQRILGENGNRHARMSLLARNGLQIGGDKLDEVFARVVFEKLKGARLDLEKEVYELLLGTEKDEDDEGEDLIVDLEALGFFGTYNELLGAETFQSSPERLGAFQSLRTSFKFLARELKIAIADGFFGRNDSENFHLKFPAGVTAARNQKLSHEIFAVGEDDSLPREEKVKKIDELLAELRDNFERTKVEYSPRNIGPHLKLIDPLQFLMRDFVRASAFDNYLRQISSEFIHDLLEGASLPRDNVLYVILTGRLLAFPLIQEELVRSMVQLPEVETLRFPNQEYSARELKESVVTGAIYARDEGLDFNSFSSRVLTNICLLYHDQAANKQKLARMVPLDSPYVKNGDGVEEVRGWAGGVRLRPNNPTNDRLRIYEIDRLNWDNPALVDAFARDFKYNLHRVTPVFNLTMPRAGDFEEDDDRFVEFAMRQDGRARVKVYPSTERPQEAEDRPDTPRGVGRPVDFSNDNEEAIDVDTESAALVFPL